MDITAQYLSVETLKQQLTPRTKAIIVVHLGGWPAEIEKFIKFCKKKNIFIIEDCSQAHGAKVGSKMVGSFADLGVFSFCIDKIITTGGEGCLIVTSNKKLAERVSRLSNHGGLVLESHKLRFNIKEPLRAQIQK